MRVEICGMSMLVAVPGGQKMVSPSCWPVPLTCGKHGILCKHGYHECQKSESVNQNKNFEQE